MKLFKCQRCAQLLYFENRQCESCGHRLGYLHHANALSALEPEGNVWRALASPDAPYRFCANAELYACNWLVPADSSEAFCAACRHNRMIPDLTVGENLARWHKIESAKRRLFYSLLRLDLPMEGLVFDILAEAPGAGVHEVVTGHKDGLITINLKEADDAERAKLRAAMGETYRTLLGHFRHESGHYFWDRLVRDQEKREAFRKFFGDERQDYGQSLQAYYANGPAPNWQENCISGYASAHPWEDFAETWAHYLHIVDTLEMAFSFGLRTQPAIGENSELNGAVDFDPYHACDVSDLIHAWLPLTLAVNAINRCMGEQDLYPFILSSGVITKMRFIHELVHAKPSV